MSGAYDEFETDPNDPLEEDMTEIGDEAESVACPSCGEMVYEEADRCPCCGDWIMPLAEHALRRHWLWVAAAVLAVGGMVALSIW